MLKSSAWKHVCMNFQDLEYVRVFRLENFQKLFPLTSIIWSPFPPFFIFLQEHGIYMPLCDNNWVMLDPFYVCIRSLQRRFNVNYFYSFWRWYILLFFLNKSMATQFLCHILWGETSSSLAYIRIRLQLLKFSETIIPLLSEIQSYLL